MPETLPPSAGDPAVRFYRRSEAAEYIRTTYNFPCSARWLAKLAVVGGGPPFHKAGRTPLYTPSDLDAWALARIGARQTSTSDRREPDPDVALTTHTAGEVGNGR